MAIKDSTVVLGIKPQLIDAAASRVARMIAHYIIAVALVISTNALIGHVDGNTGKALIVLMAFLVLETGFLAIVTGVDKRYLSCWAIWTCLLVVVYFTIALATGDFGNDYQKAFFFLLAILPLYIHQLIAIGDLKGLLDAFVNIMCILSALSLVFWLFGSILDIIPTNCTIDNTWNHTGRHVNTAGYFFVDYETQLLWLGDLTFWRNTGVFVEGPMYSFALCCALVFEWLFRQRPRAVLCGLLSATVVSTCSVTGIVAVVALVTYEVLRRIKSKRGKIAVIAMLALAVIAIAVLVGYKLSTESGGTRIDDFRAGFLAWFDNPLVGNGFDNNSAIIAHMSSFRQDNLGCSSGLAYVVASGGIVFLIPYAAAFAGYFASSSSKLALAGALFMFLWAVTIVQTLSLTAVILAIGIEMVLSLIASDMLTGNGQSDSSQP